jgi:hypothetical protein
MGSTGAIISRLNKERIATILDRNETQAGKEQAAKEPQKRQLKVTLVPLRNVYSDWRFHARVCQQRYIWDDGGSLNESKTPDFFAHLVTGIECHPARVIMDARILPIGWVVQQNDHLTCQLYGIGPTLPHAREPYIALS